MVELATPEERLLNALGLNLLTDKEAKYLKWLLARPLPLARMQELFRRRFPNSEWLKVGSAVTDKEVGWVPGWEQLIGTPTWNRR